MADADSDRMGLVARPHQVDLSAEGFWLGLTVLGKKMMKVTLSLEGRGEALVDLYLGDCGPPPLFST
jgi:hypothetical protein